MARKKKPVAQKTGVQQAIDALEAKETTVEKETANGLKIPAKKSEKEAAEKTATEKAKTTQTSDASTKKASGKKALGWVLLSFLLAAALGGLGWLFMQQKHVVEGLQTEVAANQSSMTALQENVEEQAATQSAAIAEKPKWAAQAEAMQAELAALKQADAQSVAALTAMSETVKASQGEQVDARTEWAHAELGYLVKLANHRAALAGDAAGAKKALELADDRARALGEPSLFPLRSLLADEIQGLATVPEVDIVGLSAKLESAIKRVKDLQIPLAPEVKTDKAETLQTAPALEGSAKEKIGQAFGSAWQELRSLVVIRHQSEGEKAVIAPDQRYFLYQNLRLKLETAKLALLRGEQAIYEDSLHAATMWTTDYFAGTSRDTMVAALTDLQTQKITTSLPDISGSLQWLHDRGNN